MFFAGIPAILLVFGLVLTGCDNGSTNSGGGGNNGGGDVYKLEWGVCDVSYEEVYKTIQDQQWTYTKIGTADAAYGIKSAATSAYDYCVDNAIFEDTGEKEGSFEDIVNTKIDGVSAPQALKHH